jgi:hypothetical protein
MEIRKYYTEKNEDLKVTTKTDLHDIAEILLNTATLTLNFHQPENAFEFSFISF